MPKTGSPCLLQRCLDLALRLHRGETLSVQWIEKEYQLTRRSAYRIFNLLKEGLPLECETPSDGRGTVFRIPADQRFFVNPEATTELSDCA